MYQAVVRRRNYLPLSKLDLAHISYENQVT
jgi:hypothetical protein